MVLEALLKSIRASEPGDKVVLVSNYTGEACCPACWQAFWLIVYHLRQQLVVYKPCNTIPGATHVHVHGDCWCCLPCMCVHVSLMQRRWTCWV
jgi:hypothetical protein